MEYDQVLIYDRDEMYLYRLLNFIQSNKVSKVRVSVFSNMKKMKSSTIIQLQSTSMRKIKFRLFAPFMESFQ